MYAWLELDYKSTLRVLPIPLTSDKNISLGSSHVTKLKKREKIPGKTLDKFLYQFDTSLPFLYER